MGRQFSVFNAKLAGEEGREREMGSMQWKSSKVGSSTEAKEVTGRAIFIKQWALKLLL